MTTPLKLPTVPVDSAGSVTVSAAVGAGGGDLGVGHALVGQGRLPGRRGGIGGPAADQQDIEVQLRRGGGFCRLATTVKEVATTMATSAAGRHRVVCGPTETAHWIALPCAAPAQCVPTLQAQ